MFDFHDKRSSASPAESATDLAGHYRGAGDMIAAVRSVAAAFFSGARGSHDWDHTRRVYRLCDRIAVAEKAELEVVRIAALLHDIGRAHQDSSNGSLCHAGEGARLARPIVERLHLSERQQQNVLHCIAAHRFRGNRAPETLEARVLFDGDKLDAIGAIGVARAFLFAGEVGARLHNPDVGIEETQPYTVEDTGYREYRVKLCKVRDRMLTVTGRQLAEARHRFMEEYFQRFLQEYDGKG